MLNQPLSDETNARLAVLALRDLDPSSQLSIIREAPELLASLVRWATPLVLPQLQTAVAPKTGEWPEEDHY